MKYVQFRRTINKGYLKIIPKPPTPGLGRAAVQLIACEDALLLRPAVLAHAIHLPAVAQHSRLARGEPWRWKVWRGRTKAEIHGNLLVNKGSLTFFIFILFYAVYIYMHACYYWFYMVIFRKRPAGNLVYVFLFYQAQYYVQMFPETAPINPGKVQDFRIWVRPGRSLRFLYSQHLNRVAWKWTWSKTKMWRMLMENQTYIC